MTLNYDSVALKEGGSLMATQTDDIRDFLAQRRLALVGISRNPRDFSRAVFHEMCLRGYDMVPVNPTAEEMEGRRCYARMQDIDPPVAGALLMTSPQQTEHIVRDCLEASVRRVWMHRGGGQGAVSHAAVDFCRQNGIRLVEGYCPLMFLSQTAWFHRAHGFVLKLVGRYPAAAA